MSFDLPEALVKYFGYDKGARYVDRDEYTTSQWEELVYNEVAEGRPVLYSGATVRNEGHQFVCDGYDDGLFHINWGWGGMSDGYFRLSVLDPGTQGTGGATSGLNFSEGQQIITGVCKPVEGSKEPWQGPSVSCIRLNNQNSSFSKDATGKIKGISVYSHLAYSKVYDDNYDVGFAIYDTEGNFTRVLHKNKIGFLAGYSDHKHDYSASLRLNPEDIPYDGEYSIRIVCKNIGSEKWLPMRNSEEKYLRVNVRGEKAEIMAVPEIKIEINDMALHGEPFVENMLTLTANVTNIGSDTESELTLCVNGKKTDIYASLDLAKGHKDIIRIPLIFTSKDIYEKTLEIPYNILDNGTAELSLYLNGKQVSDVLNVNVTNSIETFANLNINAAKSFESKGDSLIIPVSITNNSKKDFNNVIKCVLAERKATGKYYYLSEMSELLNLHPGEKIELNFEFKELILNKDFYVYFNVYSYGNEVKYPDDEPIYFGPYTTPDALIYWDGVCTESYMIPDADGKYNIPSETCAMKLPNNIKQSDIPISENTNCVYYFMSKYEIPSNLQTKNIVVGGSAKKIIIEDDKPFYAPFTIKAEHAEFIYTNKAEDFSTLILPFDTNENLYKNAAYFSAESNDSVWFENEYKISSGIPYLVYNCGRKEGFVTFTGDNVDVKGRCTTTAGDFHTISGTMTGMISDGNVYVFNGKDFVLVEKGEMIAPFSMFMHSNTGADKIGVSLPDDFITNDIKVVNLERQKPTMVYNLDGVTMGTSMKGLKNGIYIVNGKKVIIR